MVDDETLRVLDAREARWNKRLQMSAQYGQTLVTITLCLPLACRTAPDCAMLFSRLCGQVRDHLWQGGAQSSETLYLDGADGPACFLPVTGGADGVKRLCVETEERFPGGRMLDVDVMSAAGKPIGRAELGLPPRRCFICDNPAAVCVSQRLHPPEAVLRRARELLREAEENP